MQKPPRKPPQPPEGALIERYREATRPKLSARSAALVAGLSEGRWRQIVSGYTSSNGQVNTVKGPADTVARMAQAVGVPIAELEAVRPDAAEEARHLEALAEQQGISGTQIAAARVAHKLERPELAARLGVSPEEVQRWEAGMLIPPSRLPAVRNFVASAGGGSEEYRVFTGVPDSELLAELLRRAHRREERRDVV